MAGSETSKGAANSQTVASPSARRARMARRVGSERAPKVASRGAVPVGRRYLTIWFNVNRHPPLGQARFLRFSKGRDSYTHRGPQRIC